MRKLFFIPAIFCILLVACNSSDKSGSDNKMVSGSADSTAKKPSAYEFADQKYVDMGKQLLSEFEQGNIDAWMNSYSDSARYYWSGGDSLIGKQAIANYWKNRRGNVIKTIKFSNDIWFPIKINTPQKGPDRPGNWVFSYYQVNVTYSNGKSLQFWSHNIQHFDAADKVDQVVQFIDMAPINKALGK
jgi:hypothetical protein